MINPCLMLISLITIVGGGIFLLYIMLIEGIPKIRKLILKLNLKIIGGIDKMGNIKVKEACRKNVRNIIFLGIIGIIIACAAFGLSIWYLVSQINFAHQFNLSMGPAIGGFIGMLLGIVLYIIIGCLLYSNAIRRVYIQETTYNIIKEDRNGRSK